jgi:hypothetical protein
VCDASLTGQVRANRVAQLTDLARATNTRERPGTVQDGKTGRVIAAIFEPLQTFKQDSSHGAAGHRTNNSAH